MNFDTAQSKPWFADETQTVSSYIRSGALIVLAVIWAVTITLVVVLGDRAERNGLRQQLVFSSILATNQPDHIAAIVAASDGEALIVDRDGIRHTLPGASSQEGLLVDRWRARVRNLAVAQNSRHQFLSTAPDGRGWTHTGGTNLGLSLHVSDGEIVCVIGPNGAGKSTVFKAVYGLVGVRKGKVLCDGRDITNIRPQEALKVAGISIVPQLRSVFSQMTVQENLELGMFLSRDKNKVNERIDYVYDLFPRLGERAKQQAGTMSGGEQRMLEIGRALMWEPRLVLMDEPSAGLAPIVTKAIFAAIRRLNQEIGLTVLMIEQNARQGLQVSNRGYVIELGRQTYEGVASDLLADANVRRAFLGGR